MSTDKEDCVWSSYLRHTNLYIIISKNLMSFIPNGFWIHSMSLQRTGQLFLIIGSYDTFNDKDMVRRSALRMIV